jgi:hypothetical protein
MPRADGRRAQGGGREMADAVGVWVGALLTLALFSFLYKDNPVYKLAEHIFVGVSAGYGVAVVWHTSIVADLYTRLREPGKDHNWLIIFPAILGMMMILRFIPRYGWLSRWPIAFLLGTYSGLAIPAVMQANVLDQIGHTFNSLIVRAPGGQFDWFASLSALVVVVGVLGVLAYFFFSKEHTGPLGVASKIGIWFLMVGFGATFGYTVMARISLLIGRMQFLLGDWLHLLR